jgi:hypothetical protein
MINEKLLNRISKLVSNEDLISSLVDKLTFTDLKSLLLEVYRRKVAKLNYADVMLQYRNNRFVKPSNTSPIRLCEIDMLAFSLLPYKYKAIELSPVSPLGCASVLSTVNQNDIVTTVRNFEVCSDLTNVLALECSEQRRKLLSTEPSSVEKIKLCASHRLLRAQPNDNPNSYAHFRLIGLCTAGRDEGNYNFEEEAIVEHIDYYIRIIENLRLKEYKIESIELELVLYNQNCLGLEKRVISKLNKLNHSIKIDLRRCENYNHSYYDNVGFHLYGVHLSGEKLFLVDGGLTDWTQKFLSNKKERLLISGMGTERLAKCFL